MNLLSSCDMMHSRGVVRNHSENVVRTANVHVIRLEQTPNVASRSVQLFHQTTDFLSREPPRSRDVRKLLTQSTRLPLSLASHARSDRRQLVAKLREVAREAAQGSHRVAQDGLGPEDVGGDVAVLVRLQIETSVEIHDRDVVVNGRVNINHLKGVLQTSTQFHNINKIHPTHSVSLQVFQFKCSSKLRREVLVEGKHDFCGVCFQPRDVIVAVEAALERVLQVRVAQRQFCDWRKRVSGSLEDSFQCRSVCLQERNDHQDN